MSANLRNLGLMGLVGAGLACVGEMSSLSGSPCETDLDCPGAYTCKTTGVHGQRTCHALVVEEPKVEPPPPGTPYYCTEVKPLLEAYCNNCHGENRTASGVQTMRFDQYENDAEGLMGAKAAATRIRIRTFDFGDMPPASNAKQPTQEERDLINRWEAAGAPKCIDDPFGSGPVTGGTDAGTSTGGDTDAGTSTPPPVDAGTPQTGPVSYSAHIQPIFNSYCTGCHTTGNTKGNLNLAAGVSRGDLLNVGSICNGAVPLVKPGDPAGSMLVRKIKGTPDRCNGVMPTSAALETFDAPAVALIEKWIQEGAQDN